MKITVQVSVTETKGNSDLHSLFCSAANGDMVGDVKDTEKVKKLESLVSQYFDSFAQQYFDAGRKYEKDNILTK